MTRVRNRIFLLICLVGLVAAMVVTWQYRAEKRIIGRLVDTSMEQRVLLTTSLLNIHNDFFRSLTHDYTFWDEMVDFIPEPDFDWAVDNIRNIIDAYGGNAVWVFDTTGKLVYGASEPSRGDIIHYRLLDKEMKERLLQDRYVHAYVRTSAGVMELNGATVHPTSDPGHRTTPLGFFFTGKLLDSAFVEQLESNTQSQVSIFFTQPSIIQTDQVRTAVIPLINPGTTAPTAYVKLSCDINTIVNLGEFYDLYFFFKIIAIIVVAALVIILLISWFIVPLNRISDMLTVRGPDNQAISQETNEFRKITALIHGYIMQQEQLRFSEERFRKLADSTTAAIIIYDSRKIQFANAAAEKMLGYPMEELKETDLLKIIHPDFLDVFKREATGNSMHEDKTWRSESRFITRSGEEIFVDLSTIIIHLDAGPAFLLTAHDITDRIRMEKELVVAKERAEQSDKLKSAFLSNLSHEIRTPMNAILGFSNLLRKEKVTKTELSEYAEIIIFSTHRLMKLIDDIIEVSKIETGQILLIERPFSPDLLMDEMKDYTEGEKQKMGKRDIVIEIVPPGDAQRVTLFADMERLRMVMINLIDNALKFTKTGHIRFGYKIIGEHVKFFIEDTGIGIPANCQDDIFDRFYQLDNDNNRQFQGTGLGLTIARGLLDIMGGKIWLESEVDCGTTVHFTIPCRTEGRDMELTQKKDYSFDFTGHTILVVEDDLVNSRLLGSMIQAVNARVLYAYTGVMAIEMVKNIPDIDLVLMDIQMPGMDGLEATRNIRFWRKDLPVISQSASAHADDLKMCFDAGCVGHISKPIDTFKLYMLMGKFLRK